LIQSTHVPRNSVLARFAVPEVKWVPGTEFITRTLEAIEFWLEEHEYTSLRQMQGSMNMEKTPKPQSYIRANYMQMLDSWQQ